MSDTPRFRRTVRAQLVRLWHVFVFGRRLQVFTEVVKENRRQDVLLLGRVEGDDEVSSSEGYK
jgi:hypothetical protein